MASTDYTITIPAAYAELYVTLSDAMADYGYEMLQDCEACCKDKNKQLLRCYSLFHAAISAYNTNQTTLANLLIAEVENRLKYINLKTN